MRYLCAISCCEPDLETAEAAYRMLAAAKLASFFYREVSLGPGLMLDRHSEIYGGALVRLYLLREMSFSRYYPSFELRCGRERTANLIWPMEGAVRRRVPNDFQYILDDAWTWLDAEHEVTAIVATVAECLRGGRARVTS